MNDHKIKLLNTPEPEPVQPQSAPYPRTNLQFGPLGGGFAVQVILADDIIGLTKIFDAQAEHQLCDILIQRRRELKQQQANELAVIKHVNAHKNN